MYCIDGRPKCHIAWLHVTIMYTKVFRVKRLNNRFLTQSATGFSIFCIIFETLLKSFKNSILSLMENTYNVTVLPLSLCSCVKQFSSK